MPREYSCYFNDRSWAEDIYFIIEVILDNPSLSSALDTADEVLAQLIEQGALPETAYLDIVTLDDETIWTSSSDMN